MSSSPHTQFLTYIAKYLGVALIAGSIVHMGTLDTGATRYLVLLAIGLVLMVWGNLQEAKASGLSINPSYLFIIVGLSFATGLLSGGVQHYLDNPSYAGWLLGIGGFVTYLTYFWKEKFRLTPKGLLSAAAVAAAVILLSVFAVESMLPASHDGHTDHTH